MFVAVVVLVTVQVYLKSFCCFSIAVFSVIVTIVSIAGVVLDVVVGGFADFTVVEVCCSGDSCCPSICCCCYNCCY